MKLEKKFFGTIPSNKPYAGREITNYILVADNGMTVEITELGACIAGINVADKNGKYDNVVLSYSDLAGWIGNTPCFGAPVGRVANRTKGASFELNGKEYHLLQNDGKNNLHSTVKDGYFRRPWEMKDCGATDKEAFVKLYLFSPHMDQGFPGNLDLYITYTLDNEGLLTITYSGKSDMDTLVALTNHSYFNLGGHDSGNALGSRVWIDADQVTLVGKGNVPNGKFMEVAGTPFDFKTEKALKTDFHAKHYMLPKGYDCNFVLNNNRKFAKVASMRHESNGRLMEVYTDLPGMQMYTGNYISQKGRDGVYYKDFSGICFESQYYPDAIHHENFPSPVVKAGEEFETKTAYRFTVEE